MGVELVTAYTGTNHVSSSQDGALYAGIVGLDNYVFTTGQKLQATMEDANTLVVASGNGLINGRHFEVTDTVSFTIPTGSQDMMTSNLAVIRYTKGANSVESVTPLVLTGEPVAENPQDPAYNKGSILDGVSTVDFPIYRVVTTGISSGEPERLFDVVPPLSSMGRLDLLWTGDASISASGGGSIEVPGIGGYDAVLIRVGGDQKINAVAYRELVGQNQGWMSPRTTDVVLASYVISGWFEDSLSFSTASTYVYSIPALNKPVTCTARTQSMRVTAVYGIR